MSLHLSYDPIPDAMYDFAELNICVDYIDPDGSTNVDCLGDASPAIECMAKEMVAVGDATRWFYTVYWHCSDGGVMAVADFNNKGDAERLHAALLCTVAARRGLTAEAEQYAKHALDRF